MISERKTQKEQESKLYYFLSHFTLQLSTSRLLNNISEEIVAFQRALKEFVISADPLLAKDQEEYYVGLEGRQVSISLAVRHEPLECAESSYYIEFFLFFCSFGSKHVTPRTLHSLYLGGLVCVEGIVTKCQFAY